MAPTKPFIAAVTSRSRPSMNHAVFWLTPISRASCVEASPLRCVPYSQIAANHFRNGKRDSSNTVPLRTEKSRLHSPQRHR